ncbi:MAG: site-2 protease family protein [Clostridia bacterium]|nr:site-2 protease family protein [Clostridia bacterium]
MVSNILYVLLAIVMLGIIVTVHEFGHYCVGRLCGIGIVEFSVGFGPRLLGWERKGIQYSLRAIPLGGYCAFVGEDESNDDPRAMNNQPLWKRFLTVLAGPFMNFVLAFVVCAIMLNTYYIAETYPVVNQVVEGMPAAEAGLLPGDRILSVNGTQISNDTAGVNQMIRVIQSGDLTQSIDLTVDRGGKQLAFSISAVPVQQEDGQPDRYQIGIVFSSRTFNFVESLREAGSYMVETTGMMIDSLKNLIFKGEGLEDTAGTVGIIALVAQQAREGMYMVLWLMFIISLNLGIMNLLPIPALDGGRLLFLIVEAIRRKPIPPEKEGTVHAVGMVLLLGLFLLLTYHDIVRLISGGFRM